MDIINNVTDFSVEFSPPSSHQVPSLPSSSRMATEQQPLEREEENRVGGSGQQEQHFVPVADPVPFSLPPAVDPVILGGAQTQQQEQGRAPQETRESQSVPVEDEENEVSNSLLCINQQNYEHIIIIYCVAYKS